MLFSLLLLFCIFVVVLVIVDVVADVLFFRCCFCDGVVVGAVVFVLLKLICFFLIAVKPQAV